MPIENELVDGEPWVFDRAVADGFDEMLERSIPEYDRMRELVHEIGRRFVRPSTAIVDLGCSRGGALAPFVDEFAGRRANTFVGCEVSEPMRVAACNRFVDERDVFITNTDLRVDFPPVRKCSLVLSVLTLQFVPINYRQRIVADAHERLVDGGALIVVEKVLGASASIDAEFVELYHDEKRRAGYTREEIDRKRAALEGVLVPVTAAWNEQLLAGAGFREIDCFWRHLNFAGWVAVK